jgi:predicted GNAT family acetyltransferase
MMNDIQLKWDTNGLGHFTVAIDGEQLAEMEVRVVNQDLVVYHTEVSAKLQGQGVGVRLITRMVEYARENKLKVLALCPYVHAQFERHPDLYDDVWKKSMR